MRLDISVSIAFGCLIAGSVARPVPPSPNPAPSLLQRVKNLKDRIPANIRGPVGDRIVHLRDGIRRIPGVGGLILEPAAPGEHWYLDLDDMPGDKDSAKFKCVEWCVWKEKKRYHNRGPDDAERFPDGGFNELATWNQCVDAPQCQNRKGTVGKVDEEDVQALQDVLRTKGLPFYDYWPYKRGGIERLPPRLADARRAWERRNLGSEDRSGEGRMEMRMKRPEKSPNLIQQMQTELSNKVDGFIRGPKPGRSGTTPPRKMRPIHR